MNSSVYSADRATHLKVVVTTLVASIGIVALALSAHVSAPNGYAQSKGPEQRQHAGLPGVGSLRSFEFEKQGLKRFNIAETTNGD
jgi:hypothetical protein